MLRGVDYSFRHASKVSIMLCYAMNWVGLGVNLLGLGWAVFKKMEPRPTVNRTRTVAALSVYVRKTTKL